MATGVFHTASTGQSLQYAARVRRQREIARFADALARHDLDAGDKGGKLSVVALELGISYATALAHFARIRCELGVPVRDPPMPPWQPPPE